MENEMFKPDVDKLKYTIKIDVYENCAVTSVSSLDISYYDLIGVLETQKYHLITKQLERNLTKNLKLNKENKII